ncbi:MAG: peptide chain release factor N(5)-glutamine methyltransferase [Sphingobacteriales bacterium]
MKTIKDVFAAFKQNLGHIYEANEIEALTLMVASEINDLSKGQIKAFPEKEITIEQAEKLITILSRLQTGEPVQYILGHTEFYGLPFKVNPAVLIPRPETEELVELVLNSVDNKHSEANILDIGTGSGCIAISLKKNLPSASVSAIDISTDALKTAQQNAALNKVDVKFFQADILNSKFKIKNSKTSGEGTQKFAIIISNPPYVTLYDKTQMHTNVTDFEPHTALFVPEDDPLIFYKVIADFGLNTLTANGILFLEINESLGNETVELLASKGFKDIELRKDMSGRDRMVRAKR